MIGTRDIDDLDKKYQDYEKEIEELELKKAEQLRLKGEVLKTKCGLLATSIFDKVEALIRDYAILEARFDELQEDVIDIYRDDPLFSKFAEKENRASIFTEIASTFLKPKRNHFIEELMSDVSKADNAGKSGEPVFKLKPR